MRIFSILALYQTLGEKRSKYEILKTARLYLSSLHLAIPTEPTVQLVDSTPDS